MPVPERLKIVRFVDDPGVYLLYIGADGTELTDTYHSTIDEAFLQAEHEFGIKTSDWTLPLNSAGNAEVGPSTS